MSERKEHSNNSWAELGRELRSRSIDPLSHVSFVIYFFVAVVIVGGIGFWIELYGYAFSVIGDGVQLDPVTGVRTAVVTFFPALTGSACLQLIWAESNLKSLRAFGVFFLAITTVVALLIASTKAVGNTGALAVGCLFTLASFWAWWIANAKQRDLLDINADAPLGGDTTDGSLPGDLNGFTV